MSLKEQPRLGPRNLITDVAGLRVGQAHDLAARTGAPSNDLKMPVLRKRCSLLSSIVDGHVDRSSRATPWPWPAPRTTTPSSWSSA